MKFFTKEVKIALVAILAIVVLFVGMQFLKGKALFSSNEHYYVCFSDVSGLSASSPVFANGYRVGVVQRIDYDYAQPDRIVAVVDLDPQLQLHEGSRAEIVSDFLGNVKLELRFGAPDGRRLVPGDTIDGGMQAGLMGKAAELLPQVEQLLPKLDSILSSLNTIVADPAIAATLHNTQQLTATLTTASQRLSHLATRLGSDVPAMMTKAQGVLANTETLTANLAQVNVDDIMQQVGTTLANVQQLTASLNNPKGTAGLLLNDAQLYDNINSTMRSVDSLLVDFKKNPRRYINVSVFGRKAK